MRQDPLPSRGDEYVSNDPDYAAMSGRPATLWVLHSPEGDVCECLLAELANGDLKVIVNAGETQIPQKFENLVAALEWALSGRNSPDVRRMGVARRPPKSRMAKRTPTQIRAVNCRECGGRTIKREITMKGTAKSVAWRCSVCDAVWSDRRRKPS